MADQNNEPRRTIKRFPISFLNDVVYCSQPMPRKLAETIRALRRDHRLDYSNIAMALAECEPDAGQSFGYGKALTELACLKLNDYDPNWK